MSIGNSTQPASARVAIPIRDDGRCSWKKNRSRRKRKKTAEIVAKVEVAKLPLLPCVSKSGGLHLFLFIKQFELAGKVQDVLRAMAEWLGLKNDKIFPLQNKLDSLGSWMIVPYLAAPLAASFGCSAG